ncbi:hypothetical protein [Mucilaginibacter sp.]|uniref:hypothetical protein n=1 Tax=Mucilaginibacter sp. TaxID=1882438 RepID=UPI0035BBC64F
MRSIIFSLHFIFLSAMAYCQPKTIRIGTHSFSIQWIGFDKAHSDTVMIKQSGKGSYSIEGEQRDKAQNNYVTIKGNFEVVGRELFFDGKVVSRISYINNGEPCELNGPAVFRASGKENTGAYNRC